MTKSLLLSSLLFFATLPLWADAAKAKVEVLSLRIREEPDVSSKVVGSLSKGAEVSVVALSPLMSRIDNKVDYWFQIRSSTGLSGWAFGGYLRINHEKTSQETYAFPIDEQIVLREGLSYFFDQKAKYHYGEGYDLEHPLLSSVYGSHGSDEKGSTVIVGFLNPTLDQRAVYWTGKNVDTGMDKKLWWGGISHGVDFKASLDYLSKNE